MTDYSAQMKVAEDFARQHKDQIVADAEAGDGAAKSVIQMHQWLVRHADAPTWAMFMAAVDSYRKGKGL